MSYPTFLFLVFKTKHQKRKNRLHVKPVLQRRELWECCPRFKYIGKGGKCSMLNNVFDVVAVDLNDWCSASVGDADSYVGSIATCA